MEPLETRVQKIESLILALKITAGLLGVTGIGIASIVFYSFKEVKELNKGLNNLKIKFTNITSDFDEHVIAKIFSFDSIVTSKTPQLISNVESAVYKNFKTVSIGGVLQHGDVVELPEGTSADDWNIIVTPILIGDSEDRPDWNVNNAIMFFEVKPIRFEDSWKIHAQCHWRWGIGLEGVISSLSIL